MQTTHQDSSASQHLLSAVSGASTPAPHPPPAEKPPEIYPAAWQGRPRPQNGLNPDDGVCDPQQLGRELKKMKLVLEAKRSQHRKMDQWSHLRLLRKLISRVYLDELASDIARLEAVVANTAQELDLLQYTGALKTEAPPRRSSGSLRKAPR